MCSPYGEQILTSKAQKAHNNYH